MYNVTTLHGWGLIHTKLRNRLTTDRAGKLVFVHQNLKIKINKAQRLQQTEPSLFGETKSDDDEDEAEADEDAEIETENSREEYALALNSDSEDDDTPLINLI